MDGGACHTTGGGSDRRGVPLTARTFSIGLVLATTVPMPAAGDARGGVEHEPVPPDRSNDLALGVAGDGTFLPAVTARGGAVTTPDFADSPGEPTDGLTLAGRRTDAVGLTRFVPDTDTRRPGSLPYFEPFTPRTAPWKRLVAFDTVEHDLTLGVGVRSLRELGLHEQPAPDDERFFGDMFVDLRPGIALRIPSVGPGAKVVQARLTIGSDSVPFEILHDGAENWFLRARRLGRGRLTFELAISRAVFGGVFDDGAPVHAAQLSPRAERDADEVAGVIGVPRASRRETVEALVDYFRSFADSNDPPIGNRGAYLAIALSRKGVCRHRAYAFMVTATRLGIPTRVAMNEAHAWVEVRDARVWRRVDLGGAGAILEVSPLRPGPTFTPPTDPFGWPAGAESGEALGRSAANGPRGTSQMSGARSSIAAAPGEGFSSVALTSAETSVPRGAPLHVRGLVTFEHQPCAYVGVDIGARDVLTGAVVSLGKLATDATGTFEGVLSFARATRAGNHELFATTTGSARCARGASL